MGRHAREQCPVRAGSEGATRKRRFRKTPAPIVPPTGVRLALWSKAVLYILVVLVAILGGEQAVKVFRARVDEALKALIPTTVHDLSEVDDPGHKAPGGPRPPL